MHSFWLRASIILVSCLQLARGTKDGVSAEKEKELKDNVTSPPLQPTIIVSSTLLSTIHDKVSNISSTQQYNDTPNETLTTEITKKVSTKTSISKSTASEDLISLNKKSVMPEMLPIPMAQESSNWFRRDEDYVGLDEDGEVCVLAYFDLRITVYYTPKVPPKDKTKEIQTVLLEPTSKSRISGLCNRKAKIASLVLTWPDAIFTINFGFDDLIDSWFISQFSVQYDTSSPAFKGLAKEEKVEVVSKVGKKFWTTNRHRSFRCLVSHAVLLTDKDKKHSADVDFGQVRAQALTWNDRFLTPQHCVHRIHRDEMVPVIVGGTLVALTAVTVAAYGGFRYFKVKKVEYETMQL